LYIYQNFIILKVLVSSTEIPGKFIGIDTNQKQKNKISHNNTPVVVFGLVRLGIIAKRFKEGVG